MVDVVKDATAKAKLMTREYTGEDSPWLTKGDAFRHIMWNYILCKYASEVNRDIDESVNFVKLFTDAHEKNPSNAPTYAEKLADHQMDYHNNVIGRDLFVSYASYYRPHFLALKQVSCQAEKNVADIVWWSKLMSGNPAKRTTKEEILQVSRTIPVYIKDVNNVQDAD